MKTKKNAQPLSTSKKERVSSEKSGINDGQYDAKNQGTKSDFTEEQKKGRAIQGVTFEDKKSKSHGLAEVTGVK